MLKFAVDENFNMHNVNGVLRLPISHFELIAAKLSSVSRKDKVIHR